MNMAKRVSRRAFIRLTGAATIASAGMSLVAACAPSPASPAAPVQSSGTSTEPKAGGTLRFGQAGLTSYSHFCTLKRNTGGEEIWQRRIPAAKLLAYNEDY